MAEPVRHRQTKEAATDMLEPKATAPHSDSTKRDHAVRAAWRKPDPHLRRQRPLSVVALALTQGAQLCLVQGLRDISDQIGRVFDADRQPDRGVENAYFLADV